MGSESRGSASNLTGAEFQMQQWIHEFREKPIFTGSLTPS
jgi:hypothetical protein